MIKNLFFISSIFLGTYIQAQSIIFSENFDSPESQELWSIEDRDGDADKWEFISDKDSGNTTFSGGFAWSWSWLVDPLYPDNTLTSPSIVLPSDTSLNLRFKVAAATNEDYFQEHYAVYVLPEKTKFSESIHSIFEETLGKGYYNDSKVVNLDLSEFAGQTVKLVFRHYNSSDLLYVALDDVEVTAESTLGIKSKKMQKQTVYKDANHTVKISGFDDVIRVKVFDLKGKLILESNSDFVNIKDLSAGVYIINFYTKESVISRKIIR